MPKKPELPAHGERCAECKWYAAEVAFTISAAYPEIIAYRCLPCYRDHKQAIELVAREFWTLDA